MQIKKLFFILVFFLLFATCSQTAPAPPEATPTPPPADTPTPGETPTEAIDPAEYDPFWDDRAIFSANLIEGAQGVLQQLPQASYYRIDLRIPNDLHLPIEGHLEVRYYNRENRALDEIIFRLFANYSGGEIITSNVQVDQVAVETSLEALETSMIVPLPEPLPVGRSAVITMDFSITIPTSLGGNYGLFGYYNDVLVLDLFYPMIPAYDSYGWYREYPAPSGDLSYNDASFYQVHVDAPEAMTLVASGSMVQRSAADGRQQVTFAAGPVRDFYLAASSRFTVVSTQVGGTTINSYALPGQEQHQQQILNYLAAGMGFFNALFGDYPYREFDAFSSPMSALGIEYPGVVGLYNELYVVGGSVYGYWITELLETVVIHELAHQWFYGVVGNDQQDLPWVDESVTQYAVYLYMKGMYGDAAAEERLDEWYRRWEQLDYAEIPIGLRVRDYAREAYSPVIYGRGPLFFYQLSGIIGEDNVINALVGYYQQNRWQIATTESIRRSLEAACQCDLTDMFIEWVYP
jgi:hypothetical protein